MASANLTHKEILFDHELDVRGKNCPLPIIASKKALEFLGVGQVMKVITSDQGSVNDFRSFSRQVGFDLLEWDEHNREYSFYIKKV